MITPDQQRFVDRALELRPPRCPESSMMTVLEFIDETGFDISKLYIDKFWASLHDNRLIYIDDNLLRWMGYGAAEASARKANFLRMLKEQNIKHMMYNNADYAQLLIFDRLPLALYPSVPTGRGIGKINHILLDTYSLKLAMLSVGNGKNTHVRNHYIALEQLLFTYMRYQCIFKELSMIAELDKLRAKNISNIRARGCSMINTSPHIECVYFIRASEYVKIGRTTNIARRLKEIQVCCPIKLIVERTIITDIGATLEAKIHGIYSHKHIGGEWYTLNQLDIVGAPVD